MFSNMEDTVEISVYNSCIACSNTGKIVKTAVTFRLPEDDLKILDNLSKALNCTKTELVHRALQEQFERVFLDRKVLLLNDEDFRAVVDSLNAAPSERELKGRKKLIDAMNTLEKCNEHLPPRVRG